MPQLKKLFLVIVFLVFAFQNFLTAQSSGIGTPSFLGSSKAWVDSVFNTLSVEEKIGQLMMVRALSNKLPSYEDSLIQFVKQNKIGGVVFFQGGPVRQAKFNNKLQKASKVPLMIAIDGEWGLGMRLDSTISFPYQMALGAIQNDTLIYEMGKAIAQHCKRLGIHINFAPVVDVNNNPNNPVISYRSFGESKIKVASKSLMYMKGLQDNGVLATAKHFPGHGDTDVDSHFALPLINHDRVRLDSLEMFPFKFLISQGLGGVMVAHLSIPKLDSTPNLPSTLSKPIVTKILKEELGFKGLIFTDALDMKGITNHFGPGEIDLKAVLAGNDVLELSEDVPAAIQTIKDAIKKGILKQSVIDEKCRKVLKAKFWLGLSKYKPVSLTNLYADLNSDSAQLLNRRLIEASLTVLKNDNGILPINNLSAKKIAAISLNASQKMPFQRMLENYTSINSFNLPPNPSIDAVENLRRTIKGYDFLIIGLHQSGRPRKLALDSASTKLLSELVNENAVVSVFSNPYSLSNLKGLDKAKALVLAYYDTPLTEELTAQLLLGAIRAEGKLPVTASPIYSFNAGKKVDAIGRLKYTLPIEAGIDNTQLRKIDSLVEVALKEQATPGCQIVVARGGNVIYNKAFGYHTYSNEAKVLNSDLYDLASVTKVLASIPALMKLYDEGKFNLDATLGEYLPYFKNSNKGDLTFREMLTHQARLKAWVPFWKNTLKKNGKFKWFTFKNDSSKRFPLKVADGLYLHRRYYKKIYKEIKKSPLNEKEGYVYSDLSFYLYPLIVEKITGQKFEAFLSEQFYKPLGAYSLTFNPYLNNSLEAIIPTEYDSLFRKSLIHGRVHDEGAAMLNGISGHAGLFGTANDVAKVMQLYANKGSFGGRQFIKPSTVEEFTRCQYCSEGNRRALGFDRPIFPPTDNGNAAKSASSKSFGHAGFTGIFTWVDPEYNLVYVFLSNRVYPTRNNSKISKLNTRTNIQEVLYNSIIKDR